MFCRNCGAQLVDNATHCVQCGFAIEQENQKETNKVSGIDVKNKNKKNQSKIQFFFCVENYATISLARNLVAMPLIKLPKIDKSRHFQTKFISPPHLFL